MNKKIVKKVESKLLNDEQATAVKTMIINSMRQSYISVGTLPGDGFDLAAGMIADAVIKDAQMALAKGNVYQEVAKKVRPLKNTKKKKNARKKSN